MKKVTIFSLHLGYGGIEKSIVNLANLLVENYDVEIVSTYKLDDTPAFDIDNRVKVRYLITKIKPNREEWKNSIRKLKPVKFVKETAKAISVVLNKRNKTIDAIKKCDSDIIISTRDLFNKWVSTYAKPKAYKVAWEHNHHHGNIEYAKKVVDSCRNMDTLVLVSDSLRSFYKKMMKDNNCKCKCVYIPNMINYFPSDVSKLKNNNFVSIGRFSKEKGFVDLIEVIHEFKEKNPDIKFHLDLIGDGAEKNKIIDKIYSYGLTEYVKVHGFLKRDAMNEVLEKSSIYLMTSYTESFGIVLIEAMSFGIPCIAFTSAEGANDLITNDYNGYLVENRDFAEMVDKMKMLLDDKKKRVELGKNAREFSLKYDTNSIKQEWLDLLKRRG